MAFAPGARQDRLPAGKEHLDLAELVREGHRSIPEPR